MKYLPLFLNLKNRSVLIVGGGVVAFRKVQTLQKIGALIKIVAPTLCSNLKHVLFANKIIWIGKKFQPSMLESVFLVIVATNNSTLNATVFRYAEKYHILINTVDDCSKCSCIFPAIVDRSPVLIGISSCGASPVLIRILREKLESLLPMSLGNLAKLAGSWRKKVKNCIKDVICRRRFWEKLFYNSGISVLIEQRKFKQANALVQHAIHSHSMCINNKQGRVILVGAGPGDKELLTIRGLQSMQQADFILYDHLVNPDILDLARRDANKIYVGKSAGKSSLSQDQINQFIVQLAREGNVVVRLKGGDSFIFGRGGEELQAVSRAGIICQVVPGITAGIGAAAYAGIPLTHRDYAHSVTFLTGHRSSKHHQIDWSVFSDNRQTLVVYMGKINILNISKNLIICGRHINTPVAIISKGTCQDQKIFIGTLAKLEKLICLADKPSLLIIGDVVSFYKEINKFNIDR